MGLTGFVRQVIAEAAVRLHKRHGIPMKSALLWSVIAWDSAAPVDLVIREPTEATLLFYCDVIDALNDRFSHHDLAPILRILQSKTWMRHDLHVGLEVRRGRPRIH